ncbi:LytR/AlgR family response regulator transcription factor [Lutibacter flavus]|uniref:Two component transcriptional regulator, LytTR family n=1 Tax=Lutibacter flavus TaxID=691689 RepID=A0A238YTY3_9FLAO|nr:LytTR family DNA-binding domain-containing protein [Lutibacter flavus]SNR73919.1 two component transcriptional regulator, LytTR family [Lutibacter flavus]
MIIRCIIIDDEPLAISVIKNHLSEFQNIELIATFNTAISALQTIEENEIDVIFLDINMPKMSGLEFLRTISVKPHIVITTAYREFAVESFDLDVLDYLVKPIPFGRFLKAINKIQARINLEKEKLTDIVIKEEPFIFLKVNKKMMKIKLNDILYIESLKDYIKVFTRIENYLVHKSMTSISEELPSDNFLRIHRSFTIAINKITSVEGNTVEIDKKRIPIGRNYLVQAKHKIFNSTDFAD